MLGVTPDARDGGLGLALKLAQREHALRMGIDLIEWTYDPLQALNAHLNFAKLGVVVERVRGEHLRRIEQSAAPRHADRPVRRAVARCRHRTSSGVFRRPGVTGMRDSSVAAAVVVNPSRQAGSGSSPASRRSTSTRRVSSWKSPRTSCDMQARRPALALDWRMATRRIFQAYFGRGYRAVDFLLSREAGRGQYLLAKAASGQG